MSDKKISQLSNATTPLSGAEVFPVVQSGVTVKTPISSLYTTPSSPSFGSGQYPVVRLNATINNAIFGYALDGYQAGANNGNEWLVEQGRTALGEFNISLLGNTYKPGLMKINSVGTNATFTIPLTLTDSLYIGTSGKGIDFSATPGTGTSELLNDYEEGTWTPQLSLLFTIVGTATATGTYTKIGRTVHITWLINISAGGSVSASSGWQMQNCLPYTAAKSGYGVFGADNAYGPSNNGDFQCQGTTIYGSVGWTGTSNISFSGSATYIV